MATAIATQELVSSLCDTMTKEGLKPSIVAIQERIGGGSYSTVKRYIDAWALARARAADAGVELPDAAVEKATELARQLWAMAAREAETKSAAIRESAENKVAMISDDLEIAQKEIARLEGLDEANQAKVEQLQQQLAEAERALLEARILASRVTDLQERLAASEAAAAAARQDAEARAIECGRLSGEGEALRSQLRELTAALKASRDASGG